MKKVGIVSLGCAKNLVDSENILGLLDNDKYEITPFIEEADIIFVNTCGFIDSSKKESIETIFEMLSYGKQVVATGCLVERYYNELKEEMKEVPLMIPIRDYNHFNDLLKTIDPELTATGGLRDDLRVISTGHFSAYLKIGEGCDNRCTYCAIPIIRGGFVSRPFDEILKEARNLAKIGVKEVIVLEQDTTKYGIDLHNGENIVKLLKALLEIKEFDYVRLLYLYPDEITDELIDLIANEPRLTHYFDIPIQHSEDHILQDMNRRGNKEYLRNLFSKIRNKIPDAVLRPTVMVGFPGETEEDVKNLIDFIKEVKFDHLGAFTYSKEEGTESYNLPNHIDEDVKKKRMDAVMKAQQSISYKRNKTHIGEIMEGLVVGMDNEHYLFRSYWNAPDDVDGKIFIKSDKPLTSGDKIRVQIDDAFVYDLMGHQVD